MSAVGRSIPLISPCACHGCRAHLLPCADRPLHLCALLVGLRGQRVAVRVCRRQTQRRAGFEREAAGKERRGGSPRVFVVFTTPISIHSSDHHFDRPFPISGTVSQPCGGGPSSATSSVPASASSVCLFVRWAHRPIRHQLRINSVHPRGLTPFYVRLQVLSSASSPRSSPFASMAPVPGCAALSTSSSPIISPPLAIAELSLPTRFSPLAKGTIHLLPPSTLTFSITTHLNLIHLSAPISLPPRTRCTLKPAVRGSVCPGSATPHVILQNPSPPTPPPAS